MMFKDLKGRVCVITGGFGVIGTALTRGLAEAGVKVAVISRSTDNARKAEALSAEFGVECLGISANALDKTALEAALEEVHAKLGPVDCLVNCAGGNSPKATCALEQIGADDDLGDSFYGLDLDGFQQVYDLNFKGTLLATMIFTREMVERGKGVVVNISSMNSIRPLTKIPAYSAAKGSVNNFTQWFAVHVAPRGVRCNAIAPGFFLTEQNRFLLTKGGDCSVLQEKGLAGRDGSVLEKAGLAGQNCESLSKGLAGRDGSVLEEAGEGLELTERGEKIIAATPFHRFGKPEDLVGTLLYLLSDASAFVTGTIIPVDGGYSAFGGV